jgi:hypothetical protein
MSSGSVCQVAHTRVDVDSFHTRLFGVMYVTCCDFHNGSENGTVSMHQILCQSWRKCYRDPYNDSISRQGPNLELYTYFNDMPGSRPVAHLVTMMHTQGDPQAAQHLKLLREFKRSFVRIDIRPFTTLLRRWELDMEHANRFRQKNLACTVSQTNLCPGS